MKSGKSKIQGEEMAQTKSKSESIAAKDPVELVARQVLDEMLQPQQQLKQAELEALEVSNYSDATEYVTVPTNDKFVYAPDTNGLFVHSMGMSFDPGGKHNTMMVSFLAKELLQLVSNQVFNQKPRRMASYGISSDEPNLSGVGSFVSIVNQLNLLPSKSDHGKVNLKLHKSIFKTYISSVAFLELHYFDPGGVKVACLHCPT